MPRRRRRRGPRRAGGRCATFGGARRRRARRRRRGRHRAGGGVAEGVRIVKRGVVEERALGRERRGGAVLGGEHREPGVVLRRVPGRVLGLGAVGEVLGDGRRAEVAAVGARVGRVRVRGVRARARARRALARARPELREEHARGARLEVLGAHRRERPGVAGARSGRGRRRGAKWRGAGGESSSATHPQRRPKAIRNGRKELRSARRDRGPSFRRGGAARTACAGRTRGPRASGRRTRAGGFLSRGSGRKPIQ